MQKYICYAEWPWNMNMIILFSHFETVDTLLAFHMQIYIHFCTFNLIRTPKCDNLSSKYTHTSHLILCFVDDQCAICLFIHFQVFSLLIVAIGVYAKVQKATGLWSVVCVPHLWINCRCVWISREVSSVSGFFHRRSAWHIPHWSCCGSHCGRGGHVLHHLLWMHRSSARKHSAP